MLVTRGALIRDNLLHHFIGKWDKTASTLAGTVKEKVLRTWTGAGYYLSSDLTAATDRIPLEFV